jgi:hypothetical protein
VAKLPDVTTLGATCAQAELLKLRVRYPGTSDFDLLMHALALKHEKISELEDEADYQRGVACDQASKFAMTLD